MRALVLAAFVAACGPAQPAATTTTPTPPAHTLDDMVDAMCACKTPACADQVKAQFAGVDTPGDTAPHVVSLRDAAKACETTAREGDEVTMLDQMEDAMCACKDAPCTDSVEHQYKAFWDRELKKYRDAKPTAQVMKIAERMGTCEERAREASGAPSHGGTGLDHTGGDWHPAPPPGSDSAGGDGTTGIAECDAYLHAVEAYAACDKVPQEARDAVKESIDAIKQSAQVAKASGDDAVKAVADSCKQGADAIAQVLAAMGC